MCMWLTENSKTICTETIKPQHDKTKKWHVRPAKTQISLIWVFAGRTVILLVLSLGSSNQFTLSIIHHIKHFIEIKVSIWDKVLFHYKTVISPVNIEEQSSRSKCFKTGCVRFMSWNSNSCPTNIHRHIVIFTNVWIIETLFKVKPKLQSTLTSDII